MGLPGIGAYAVLALLCTAALAGCGSSSKSASESPGQYMGAVCQLRTFGSVEASSASLVAFKNPDLVKAASGQPACRGLSLTG